MSFLLPIEDLRLENAVFINHYRKDRLLVQFIYDPKTAAETISLIKSFGQYYYHGDGKYWSLPYDILTVSKLTQFFTGKGYKIKFREYSPPKIESVNKDKGYKPRNYQLSEPQLNGLDQLSRILTVKRYSNRTIRSYSGEVRELFQYFKDKYPDQIDGKMVREYTLHRVNMDRISESKQSMLINAIKFYFVHVLEKDTSAFVSLRPKKSIRIPEVLSEEEVRSIFSMIQNLKHKCILMIIYSGGLRISEAVNLKIADIDFESQIINVKGGKGKKDRKTILSKKVSPLLKRYLEQYGPIEWLFEGELGGQYSPRTIRQIFRKAKIKAGINRKVTVHTLRHSFATHLLEGGTDIRYIQALLGHESIKTTEIYTHITNKKFKELKSPLDAIDLGDDASTNE